MDKSQLHGSMKVHTAMKAVGLFVVFLALSHPAQATTKQNISLAYLYIIDPHDETGSAWVVESETAFRLAVQEINNNPSMLPGFHILPRFLDTNGEQVTALHNVASVVHLDDDDCVDHAGVAPFGFIGTGYSTAARAAAMYASIANVPMISPGSTWTGLVDKSAMPYFFRSIAPDTDAVAGLAELAFAAGWRNIAVLMEVDGAIEDNGAYQTILEHTTRLGVRINTRVTFKGSVEGLSEEEFEPVLDELKASGNTIFIAYMRSVQWETFAPACRKAGMLDSKYVWLSSRSFMDSDDFYGPNVIFVDAYREAAADEKRAILADLWKQSTSAEDGAELWDNGDGLVDSWAEYVYDTVHVFAEALQAVVDAHGAERYTDGSLLREALLASSHIGVTGQIEFSQVTQDRVSAFNFYSRPHADQTSVFVFGTYSSDPAKREGAGPVDATFQKLGWVTMPEDGSQLDPSLSTIASSRGKEITAGDTQPVLLALRNSFAEAIAPERELPAGLEVSSWEGEGAEQRSAAGVVTWEMEENINGTNSLTILNVVVQEPGVYYLSFKFNGRELSGAPVALTVEAGELENDDNAEHITYIAVSSVFLTGFGIFIAVLCWRYPEYAKIVFNFLVELVTMTMNAATRVIDIITDALATASVIQDPTLKKIEPWYLAFLCLSLLFLALEMYVTSRDCLRVRSDMRGLSEGRISKMKVHTEKRKRHQMFCALSLLNCLIEDLPMLVLNIIIIVMKDGEEATVYMVSVLINLLMLGWKFADAKVLAVLREDVKIYKKFDDYAQQVEEAANHDVSVHASGFFALDKQPQDPSVPPGSPEAACSHSRSSRRLLNTPRPLPRGSSFFHTAASAASFRNAPVAARPTSLASRPSTASNPDPSDPQREDAGGLPVSDVPRAPCDKRGSSSLHSLSDGKNNGPPAGANPPRVEPESAPVLIALPISPPPAPDSGPLAMTAEERAGARRAAEFGASFRVEQAMETSVAPSLIRVAPAHPARDTATPYGDQPHLRSVPHSLAGATISQRQEVEDGVFVRGGAALALLPVMDQRVQGVQQARARRSSVGSPQVPSIYNPQSPAIYCPIPFGSVPPTGWA